MNKRKIEKLIPSAIDALISCGVVKDGKYPSEFKGYISSLGASIVQAGLITTVIDFEKNDGNTAADKPQVINVIFTIMKEHSMLADVKSNETFTAYLVRHQKAGIETYYSTEHRIKKMAVAAGTALKLAIRTFKQDKND